MGAPMKEYDFDQVTFVFAGIIAKGFVDGSAVTLEEAGPRFVKKVGIDGTVTRSKLMDRSGKCTIKLMQSSEVNDQYSAIAQQDIEGVNGAGVGALQIQDNQGRTLHHAAEAWISEVPKPEWDKEATGREWVFEFANVDSVFGGN